MKLLLTVLVFIGLKVWELALGLWWLVKLLRYVLVLVPLALCIWGLSFVFGSGHSTLYTVCMTYLSVIIGVIGSLCVLDFYVKEDLGFVRFIKSNWERATYIVNKRMDK